MAIGKLILHSHGRARRTRRGKLLRQGKRSVPKSLTYSMWNFERSFLSGTVDTNAEGIHVATHTISLGQIPAYAEFTALFEQYKINSVTYSFVPFANVVSVAEQNTVIPYTSIPVIMRYTDYDDDDEPDTNEDTFMQNGKVRRDLWRKVIKVKFTPKVLTMAYKTALTTSYSPSDKKLWIDCDDFATPHFGLKVMVTGAGLTAVGGGGLSLGKLYVKVDLSFKGLK